MYYPRMTYLELGTNTGNQDICLATTGAMNKLIKEVKHHTSSREGLVFLVTAIGFPTTQYIGSGNGTGNLHHRKKG